MTEICMDYWQAAVELLEGERGSFLNLQPREISWRTI